MARPPDLTYLLILGYKAAIIIVLKVGGIKIF